MKVLVVFAHPEEKSFNKSLLDTYVEHLEAQGNEVKVSDLYKENFKAVVDRDDFLNLEKDARLKPAYDSYAAFAAKQLTPDVIAEMDKLIWADTIVFHFPLWWFGMPAILKGWVDRVFACGFAYGFGEYSDTHFGDRYGEGTFTGKKAFVVTTCGGSKEQYSDRGINGPIENVLFTINHGLFFYTGCEVFPPVVIYRTDGRREEGFQEAVDLVKERFDNFDSVKSINYRKQNFGDYEIPSLRLKEGLEQPNESGYDMHITKN
ncbi:NAD(P)H-dependent oxidoreductase KABA2_09S02354 [Maudiozyma barnettii]|uniref:Flavodoxin-like fold domain-containing protein n=1 Tax=Maudiozyma barnettii TaxID=61262 RepID=A0A8H2ZJA8_9SACH|nr:uncharacterized protein KABA2_09S02354 [Kazachstania barnettii]CAB4256337.1 similar to Kazachstania africana KAFR_0B05180 hypothetical protein [Kazachstania barnettii]